MGKDSVTRFRCDQCDDKKDFITSPTHQWSELEKLDLKRWITVVTEDGTPNGLVKVYCSRSCEIIGARSSSSITLTDNPKHGENASGSSIVKPQ